MKVWAISIVISIAVLAIGVLGQHILLRRTLV